MIGDDNRPDQTEDIVCSEEEFAKKMAEEVNDEAADGGDDDLDLY